MLRFIHHAAAARAGVLLHADVLMDGCEAGFFLGCCRWKRCSIACKLPRNLHITSMASPLGCPAERTAADARVRQRRSPCLRPRCLAWLRLPRRPCKPTPDRQRWVRTRLTQHILFSRSCARLEPHHAACSWIGLQQPAMLLSALLPCPHMKAAPPSPQLPHRSLPPLRTSMSHPSHGPTPCHPPPVTQGAHSPPSAAPHALSAPAHMATVRGELVRGKSR